MINKETKKLEEIYRCECCSHPPRFIHFISGGLLEFQCIICGNIFTEEDVIGMYFPQKINLLQEHYGNSNCSLVIHSP